MINDLLLRWIVTALFAVGAIDSIRTLAARRSELRLSITHCLMLLMSLAMIVMAWPQGNQLPLLPLLLLFALGTVTAVVFAVRRTNDRLLHVYTAVMMASMVWMYAVIEPAHCHLHSSCYPRPPRQPVGNRRPQRHGAVARRLIEPHVDGVGHAATRARFPRAHHLLRSPVGSAATHRGPSTTDVKRCSDT